MAFVTTAVVGCPPVYGPRPPPAVATQPAPATVAAEPELDAPLPAAGSPERSPTPTEMASAAQEMTARMGRMLRRVERRYTTAESAADALRRDCVAERLLRVRALVAAAAAGRERLERAVAQHQLTVSQEEYSAVGVAFLNVRMLAGEARQCMIDPPRIGHTETKVTVEPLKPGQREAAAPTPATAAPRR